MFDYPYVIEILTPKRSTQELVKEQMSRFAERYQRALDSGFGISVPDNPMGQPRYGALETIDLCALQFVPERVVMNLNTFHTKGELDVLLKKASKIGLRYILVIRGDGGPLLPKLDPQSIGGKANVATSIDLVRYINMEHPNMFVTGVAFNPYNRMPFETNRLRKKIEAGAKFIITQPIIGCDPNVERLRGFRIPIIIEAWMSKNVDLLYKAVGKEKDKKAEGYDPVENLKILHGAFPESCIYLSMLSFKEDWEPILPKL